MPVLPKTVDKLTKEEYVNKHLADDSNEQDRVYLSKRYEYEKGNIEFKELTNSYIGTSFQKLHYPGLK